MYENDDDDDNNIMMMDFLCLFCRPAQFNAH